MKQIKFKFKKEDILVPKKVRTFSKLIHPKLVVEANKDRNYILKTLQNKLVKFSFLFIESNYEKEDEIEEETKESEEKK